MSTPDGNLLLARPAFPAPLRRYGAVLRPDRVEFREVSIDQPMRTSAADPAYPVTDKVVASVEIQEGRNAELLLLRDLIAAAQITGAHRHLLGLTTEFAKTRVQFGKAIAEFQGLQHVLVDVFSWLEAADLLLTQTFALAEHHGVLPQRGQAAVAFVRAKASWALQRAYEVLGGVGFMTEHPLNHYTREMVVLLAALGDTDTHYERQAELVHRGAWRSVV